MFDSLLNDINSCNLFYFKNNRIINNALLIYAKGGSDTLKIRELVIINELVNPQQFNMHFLGDMIKIEKNVA